MCAYNKKNIAIIGATGYTCLDLILMLSKHPKVRIKYLCATKNLGKKISYFDKRIKKALPKITSITNINFNKLDLVEMSSVNEKLKEFKNKVKKAMKLYL